MKNVLAALVVLATVSSANATGFIKRVHDCTNNVSDDNTTIGVRHISMSAPGGPVSSWTEAEVSQTHRAGTYSSDSVKVTVVAAMDGGPVLYLNKAKNFALRVLRQSGVLANGQAANVLVEARFRDVETGKLVKVEERWLVCK
ncbi:MAG TPA: hypothetical protein VFV50_09225 [Bdellovibrionales bacterium]|nr:hypothetical protein [Bdellovibrionales bacterium]